ncbi:MAG TPA: hypothetical protein VK524_31960, partial [Polyangiaceae bacterium]|nr:hypothetical protein [Polyangiaceae bacterium]
MMSMGGVWNAAVRGVLAVAALVTVSCEAGTLSVTAWEDGAEGSLREVIDRANRSADPTIRIEVMISHVELTLCGKDDTNAGGDLDITTSKPITLVGRWGLVHIRQTCPGERILEHHGSAQLTIGNAYLHGGSLVGDDPSQPAQGGGLRSAGDVALEGVYIVKNSVRGAAATTDSAAAGGAQGGGVYVAGALHANNARIEENTAEGGAGTAFRNDGGFAEGGGVYAGGAITLTHSFLDRNRALGRSGSTAEADAAPTPGSKGGTARGGGIAQSSSSTGSVTLVDVRVTANSAEGG